VTSTSSRCRAAPGWAGGGRGDVLAIDPDSYNQLDVSLELSFASSRLNPTAMRLLSMPGTLPDNAHLRQARSEWRRIGRADRVAELDREFGAS
jgi:hypothetical protein